MEQKKNNSLLFTAGLVIVLLGSVYLVFQKFFGQEEESNITVEKTAQLNINKDAETDSISEAQFPADSTEKPQSNDSFEQEVKVLPQEKLPSIDDIDEDVKSILAQIENNLDRAYQLQPSNKNRIKLLEQTGQIISSAQEEYSNPFLNVMKGDLKMLQGENVAAVEAYEQAMLKLGSIASIERNHAGACYNAAIDLIKGNDTDRAIVLMEQFYNFSDNDENGRSLLLDWYKKRTVGLLRSGKNQEGLDLIQKALNLNPNDHVAQFNSGIAYFRLLDYNKAIRKFKRCLELNPNDTYSKNYLFAIYTQKGDTLNAALYETEATVIQVPVK